MKNTTLGGFSTIDGFVADKLKRFSESKRDLAALFEFMFSERENVMFERSAGYRIIKTTYGEVRERSLRRAAVLRSALSGTPSGSVIGLYLDNSADWIESFWAILACGFRPLLMNTRLDKSSLEQAMECVGAEALIAADGTAGFSKRVIHLGGLEPGEGSLAPGRFGEGVFVMSSGTSEHVKVCEYTGAEFYHMICDSFRIITECSAIKKHYNGQLKLLAFLPFCHIFGFAAVYLWFGFFSRTFVLLKDYAPSTIMDTIRRHEVTHIFAVPLFWNKVYGEAMKAINARGEKTAAKFRKGLQTAARLSGLPALSKAFRRVAFKKVRGELFGSSIRFLISGGSEINGDVLRFFNGIGYRLANGYGMTETGITSVELSDDMNALCSGSVGHPFSSVEYRLGENGELLVRGSTLASRIFEGDRITARSGWFHTSDIAEQKDGRWFIRGRLDDIVISPTGENLNPVLIEDKLSATGVRGICLTSVRENGLIAPVIVASLDPLVSGEGIKKAYEDIKAQLAELGLDGQISRIVLVREPLIGDDDFKLNRGRIAKRLESGGYTAADPAGGARSDESDDLTDRICGLFAKVLGKTPGEIAPNTDFFLDAGGSSLDYYTFASELQDEFGVPLPAEQGRLLSRPCEIADLLRRSGRGEMK